MKNIKKSVLFFTLLLPLLILAVISQEKNVHDNNMIVEKCIESEPLETSLRVFVDNSINKLNKEDINRKILSLIETSNRVLNKSCIPLKRNLTSVHFVDNLFTPYNNKEFSLLYERMLNTLPPKEQKHHLESLNEFFVILLKDLPFDYNGFTYPHTVSRMAAITLDGNKYVLEHELGHLSLAGHERSFTDKFDNDPRAYAYNCGIYRTIMNENTSDGVVIGIYSSPYISIGKEKCGRTGNADNSQVIRDWVSFMRNKSSLLEQAKGL